MLDKNMHDTSRQGLTLSKDAAISGEISAAFCKDMRASGSFFASS
jgi:hypothetical protein